MWRPLYKRDDCVNNDEVDTCERYTSKFLTTGVPLIIGLCLFLVLGIVLFVIVRRKRQQSHAQEAEKNRHIDDDIGDVELVITGPRNPDATYKHWEARGSSPGLELDNPFEHDSMVPGRDVSPSKR
ncbi:hypothetical protein G647_06986 [Cladophialophora carrionii CBS 160.54]|uniref:Uncharacterized protein n=1 Tax=Cladophialophora carrionii CBS 160.54 TaxID=1279043 RepID=V9D135_9EURO|nr:uncharacterized protein G647_06986 [Cladophialophora carrionii CBS 160.54]ETI20644.1 hypothetical protein G647_06986 [Cladophialophora carrionii CBS 160.54]